MLSIKSRNLRARSAGAAAIVLLSLLPACGSAGTNGAGAAFWQAFQIGGDEVEGYGSVREMAASADLVVLGRFDAMTLSRTIQGDAPQDLVGYAAATVEVVDTLAGVPPKGNLIVEFIIPTTDTTLTQDGMSSVVKSLAADLPDDLLVLFLRNKGGAESAYYRLVNSLGAWTDASGALTAPLNVEAQDPYAQELTGISTVEALADLVRD